MLKTSQKYIHDIKPISNEKTTKPLGIDFGATSKGYSGYGFSQWEKILQCEAVSHWLSPCPEWYFRGLVLHKDLQKRIRGVRPIFFIYYPTWYSQIEKCITQD